MILLSHFCNNCEPKTNRPILRALQANQPTALIKIDCFIPPANKQKHLQNKTKFVNCSETCQMFKHLTKINTNFPPFFRRAIVDATFLRLSHFRFLTHFTFSVLVGEARDVKQALILWHERHYGTLTGWQFLSNNSKKFTIWAPLFCSHFLSWSRQFKIKKRAIMDA